MDQEPFRLTLASEAVHGSQMGSCSSLFNSLKDGIYQKSSRTKPFPLGKLPTACAQWTVCIPPWLPGLQPLWMLRDDPVVHALPFKRLAQSRGRVEGSGRGRQA